MDPFDLAYIPHMLVRVVMTKVRSADTFQVQEAEEARSREARKQSWRRRVDGKPLKLALALCAHMTLMKQ